MNGPRPAPNRRTVIALSVLVLAPALNACSGGPTLSLADQVEIYAAVIERIYEIDDTFGGELQPPVLYLLDRTDDSVGDPGSTRSPSTAFDGLLRDELAVALAELPAKIEWVASRDQVPLDPETHAVADGGALFTLGNLHMQAGHEVHISASIYVAMLVAGGQTYIVERVAGVWTITGTTDVMWIR